MKAIIVAGFLMSAAGLSEAALAAEAVTPPSASVVDERAARLDKLFADLLVAPSVAEGKALEHQIIGEWLKSGDPETDALMVKVLVAMEVDAFNVALSLLDTIVEKHPDYAEGWNKRATVYYMISAYDKSLADIEQTLRLEPRHFGALAGLGMIMNELGDKRRALTAFERAMAVDPVMSNGKAVIEKLKDEISKDI